MYVKTQFVKKNLYSAILSQGVSQSVDYKIPMM